MQIGLVVTDQRAPRAVDGVDVGGNQDAVGNFQIDDPSVVLSALKKEEKGDGLILRCYNGDVRERTARLKTGLLVAGEVRLDETGLRSIKDPERFLLKPDQNKTLLLKKR